MTGCVDNFIKDLDIQDEEEMQRKIKRQKININGKQNTVASSSLYSSKFINHKY